MPLCRFSGYSRFRLSPIVPSQSPPCAIVTPVYRHTFNVDFYWPGVVCARLGKQDEALRLLENGYQQHAAAMLYLAVDPFWYA
jgi:hypothetical protein